MKIFFSYKVANRIKKIFSPLVTLVVINGELATSVHKVHFEKKKNEIVHFENA